MRRCRSFLLLEVLVGLALLAALGVMLLRVQAGATRQFGLAQERSRATQRLAALLAEWQCTNQVVTLPAEGAWPDGVVWRREIRSAVVRGALTATLVRVVVSRSSAAPIELTGAEWLVPPRPPKGHR